GCCNELNAAYSADGYALSVSSNVSLAGLGCLVTTLEVEELSALNQIVGAHSERIPIFHLVGIPSTSQQAKRLSLHHLLGD
ncbi:hypothetical protein CROQUDRAFT_8181, partial [Cronartium quercuum f. sp. fusiforme G11]